MNTEQIRRFVLRYLEAYNCGIIEISDTHVTVKLSPEADKELTNRAYYWSFVERTGAEPETMTYTFVFDPEKMKAAAQTGKPPMPAPAGPGSAVPPGAHLESGESILGRYFGFVPTTVVSRVPRDEVTYGSRRLLQLFDSVRTKGRYARLFEEPEPAGGTPSYEAWLLVNFKVELTCDMKRSEIHSLGIGLASGIIREQFYDHVLNRKLTPRLPNNIRLLPDQMTLQDAAERLESCLEQTIKGYDHSWADSANERLQDELARVHAYYGGLLQTIEPDQKPEAETQYEIRKQEIEWQYRPRIRVSVINCGCFHLQVPERARAFTK
jgi:hypothetical protein